MTGQVNFGSHTDSVVAVAAALVNLATPGCRQGRDYQPPTGAELRSQLAEALQVGRRPTQDQPATAQVSAFCLLAQEIRSVFEAIEAGHPDQAARLSNELLDRYRPTPYLDRHDGQPWHLHFHGDPERDRSGWGGGISVALATVLGSEHAGRLGTCQAAACDRVFVDTSKNGARRFCSVTCQNRVKAAAHRARTRS